MNYERCGRVVNTLNKSRTWIMTINANEMPWHGLKASDINWNMTATESNGIITVEGTAGNDCYTPQYGEKTLYACTSTAEDCSKDDRASTIIKFHNSGGASSDIFYAYARKMETISNIKPVLNSDGANNGCTADITNNSNCCSLPVVVAYKGLKAASVLLVYS